MKKTAKTIFSCQSCGYQAPKWMGKCPDCGTWDSFVEERPIAGSNRGIAGTARNYPLAGFGCKINHPMPPGNGNHTDIGVGHELLG